MRYKNFVYVLYCMFGIAASIFIQGCSKDDDEIPDKNKIVVPFALNANQKDLLLASFNNSSYTVNRVLILPFKKNNEAATNDDANFIPDFGAAKQFNVNTFPAYATIMLNLTQNTSYKVLVVGYNRNDYDFSNPTATGTRFSINSISNPISLENIQLSLTSPVVVPEFFVCTCSATLNNVPVGNVFLAQRGIKLSGGMKRLVSGLSLEITNIPAFVDSVTLVAERLVTAVKAKDATPTAWQIAGDSGNKTLGKQAPINHVVSFKNYLLPTFDAHKTKLFLDVHYGRFTERYTVKVPDVAGVSSANSITFMPNQAVEINGNYSHINLGFTISGTINLDDNSWDGIH